MQLVESAPLVFEQLTESEILNILGCGENKQNFIYLDGDSLSSFEITEAANQIRSLAS